MSEINNGTTLEKTNFFQRIKPRNVEAIYILFQTTFSLLIWTPIFYQCQKLNGISDTNIFQIQTIYYFAFAFAEIPTGLFADLFGTLKSMKLGALILVVSNLLPALFPNYTGFLIHFLLLALARSLISGASSAYLFDYLKDKGDVSHYKQIEGKARAVSLVVRVVCFAAAGNLMEWNLMLPYWITAITAAISLYFSTKLPILINHNFDKKESRPSIITNLTDTFAAFKRTPFLIFVIIQGIAIFVLVRIVIVNLFQPILLAKDVSLVSHGMVLSLMTLSEALGSFKPGILGKKISDLRMVFFVTTLMALSVLFIPYLNALGTIIALGLFSLLSGFAFPVQKQLMNESIPDSRNRATVLSVESIIDRLATAGAAAILGSFVAENRIDQFLMYAAIISIVISVSLALLRLIKKHFQLREGK